MMNPPDRPCYELVLQVNESCTVGTVISFKNVLDKTSSISSGALADHSSLSESSENCNATFVLPRTSRSDEGLSVSTSSSSGLSVSQNQQKVRPQRPCFSKIRILCSCGKSGCSSQPTTAPAADTFQSAAQNLESHPSDMDLTDPLGLGTSTSEETDVSHSVQGTARVPKDDETRPTEEEGSRPAKISLRPSRVDPVEPSVPCDAEENRVPILWDWTSRLLEAFCFPDKLDICERRPEIPSHFIEDDHSVLFGMVWLILTEHARVRNEMPPCVATRMFYDPSVTDCAWPKEVHKCLGHMSQTQITAIYEDFVRIREIAFDRYPHLKRDRRTTAREEELRPESPVETCENPSSSETEEEERPCEVPPEPVQPELIEKPCKIEDICEDEVPVRTTSPVDSQPVRTKSRKRRQDEPVGSCGSPSSPPSKRTKVDSSLDRPTSSTGAPAKVLFVYARCDKWYYPGVMYCTIDEWDNAEKPLKLEVTFCDGEEKALPFDQVFPLDRLPPGAGIQRQASDSIYVDVHFIEITRRGSSDVSLRVQHSDGIQEEVPFKNTALSPKDVIRLRSAMKESFYPSKMRMNFTVLSEGAIISTTSRRCRTQKENKPQDPKEGGESNSAKSEKNQPAPVQTKASKAAAPKAKASSKPAEKKKSKPSTVETKASKPAAAETGASKPTNGQKSRKPAAPNKTSKPSTPQRRTYIGESTSDKTTSMSIDERIRKCARIKCLGTGCTKLFRSLVELEEHRQRQIKNKQRRHYGQAAVFLCDAPNCPFVSSVKQQFRHHLTFKHREASPTRTSVVFTKPSGSGTARKYFQSPSESDTDTSPVFFRRKYARPSGAGLQEEAIVLGETVKSFTGFKNASKNEATTEIFRGFFFILTRGVGESRSHATHGRQADSESDSTDIENYYRTTVEFNVAALQRAIELGGGKLVPNVTDLPSEVLSDQNPTSAIIVSNHPCTTPNYIHGVALGLTILRHDTILECSQKGVSLKSVLAAGSADLLPPGWNDVRNEWVTPRTSRVTPLTGLTLMTVLKDSEFWHTVIRLLGGRALEWLAFSLSPSSGVFAVIADPSITNEKRHMASVRSLPILTTQWLIQALITGGVPPVYNYELRSPANSTS